MVRELEKICDSLTIRYDDDERLKALLKCESGLQFLFELTALSPINEERHRKTREHSCNVTIGQLKEIIGKLDRSKKTKQLVSDVFWLIKDVLSTCKDFSDLTDVKNNLEEFFEFINKSYKNVVTWDDSVAEMEQLSKLFNSKDPFMSFVEIACEVKANLITNIFSEKQLLIEMAEKLNSKEKLQKDLLHAYQIVVKDKIGGKSLTTVIRERATKHGIELTIPEEMEEIEIANEMANKLGVELDTPEEKPNEKQTGNETRNVNSPRQSTTNNEHSSTKLLCCKRS